MRIMFLSTMVFAHDGFYQPVLYMRPHRAIHEVMGCSGQQTFFRSCM